MLRRVFLVLILVSLVGGAAYWWLATGEQAAVYRNTLELHGNVDIRQVYLAFNGSERIVSMHFEEGQTVHAGEVLAAQDDRRVRHAVEQLAAQVDAQAQVVARLEAGSRAEEIAAARARRDIEQTSLENARRAVARAEQLVANKLASEEQLDNARTAADTAAARLRVAQQELALAEAGPRAEDIAGARATWRAYQAQLALTRQQLDDMQLVAPSDGVIENRLLQPGDMAGPQNPVYVLALSDPLWVRAYVDEPDLGKLVPGMPAEVTTDSYPGHRYQGWIGFISPTAEFTPKSVETREVRTDLVYQVRVMVCNPEGQLRLGMPATVRLLLDQSKVGVPPC